MNYSNPSCVVEVTWFKPFGVVLSECEIEDVEQLCDDILNEDGYFDESDSWILNLIVKGVFRSRDGR